MFRPLLQRPSSGHKKLKFEQAAHCNSYFFCCGAAIQRGSWPPHS